MTDTQLSNLDTLCLAERLRVLTGEERHVQPTFLLHLDALDRRRGYAELGYPSLWEYCLRALHLREGAAGRRIGAMRVLRRFPALGEAVRDGRLCLSTLCVLGPVLTAENVEEITARAAYKTKAEVDAIAASVKPRQAPSDGVRRLPGMKEVVRPERESREAMGVVPSASQGGEGVHHPGREAALPEVSGQAAHLHLAPGAPATLEVVGSTRSRAEEVDPPRITSSRRPAPAELRATDGERWSLRVTLDAEARRDLETLTALLGHKVPDGDLAAVLKEALRCAIEKHGVRRGAVVPARKQVAASTPPVVVPEGSTAPTRTAVPAEVRRQVWARDAGRCTFVGRDGTRCESRWQLELDHVVPRAHGGPSTVDNLRLRCRTHNLLHAERVFGRAYMDRFRSRGEDATAQGR